MRKTIIECVRDYAEAIPSQVAVIDRKGETTYEKLFGLVKGYRHYLLQNGVKKGSVVILRASQDLEYAVLYLSIHSVGGIVASLEKNIPLEEMEKIAVQISADFLLADDAASENECPCCSLSRGDVIKIAEENADAAANDIIVYPSLDDTADILFTTGTTGSSKGVELSHKALVATAENLIYGCGYRPDTVIIVPGPLNHANAIRKMFTTFVNGSSIYLLNGMVNIRAFYSALDYGKGTIACCLPPANIRTLFSLTNDKLAEYADRIDFIESATSPLPEPDKIRLCNLLPNTRLYNNYGSSEAASVCMYDYHANPGKISCIGKPLPNSEIIIVDDERRKIESSAQNTGLIACKGDVNMKGYVNAPEMTREVLFDGIVYTSDMGYIDEEGYVYIVGRKGDVINVGGLKVSPVEVEEAALSFEGIEDCICTGIEDKISGNALKLLVVQKEGTEFNPQKIRSYLSSKLESYKVPRFYEKTDEIKKTYNGKTDRKAYR